MYQAPYVQMSNLETRSTPQLCQRKLCLLVFCPRVPHPMPLAPKPPLCMYVVCGVHVSAVTKANDLWQTCMSLKVTMIYKTDIKQIIHWCAAKVLTLSKQDSEIVSVCITLKYIWAIYAQHHDILSTNTWLVVLFNLT